jgi:hypothetical protein
VQNKNRPDLSERNIVLLLVVVIAAAAAILPRSGWPAPGSVSGQLFAAAGALLLLAPLLFLVMKRSGLAASPPTWFIAHVLATMLGGTLIFVHVAAGDWLTPPGLVLLLLALLILQGSLLRVIFSSLLRTLDPAGEEALFSPALQHWLRRPLSSLRYQLLAEREARMVGARSSAGKELGWSRRIHMLFALGFYLGLLAHVIVVLFFAGYAAGGEPIDWWHITAWGG